MSFSSQLDNAHRSPWLPLDPDPALASERAFPYSVFRQASHQWHGRWDVDCEHFDCGTSLSSALLLNCSVYLAHHREVGYNFRNSCVQGLLLHISFLCAVMETSSSPGSDSCFLPITSDATHLTPIRPLKTKRNSLCAAGRSKNDPSVTSKMIIAWMCLSGDYLDLIFF